MLPGAARGSPGPCSIISPAPSPPASHCVPRVPTKTPKSQRPLQPGAGTLEGRRTEASCPSVGESRESEWWPADPERPRSPGVSASPSGHPESGTHVLSGPLGGKGLPVMPLAVPAAVQGHPGGSGVTLLSAHTALTPARSPVCPRVSRSLSLWVPEPFAPHHPQEPLQMCPWCCHQEPSLPQAHVRLLMCHACS